MCVCVCVFAVCAVLSHVQLFVTPWTIAYQALLSMEFSRQEFGAGWYFLLWGIFLTKGSNSSNSCLLCLLLWQVDSLPLSHLGSPYVCLVLYIYIIHTHTHTLIYGILPDGSDSKEPASSANHLGSISGSIRSPGEGNGFLPGEFQEQGSLTGYNSPWGHKESDTTEQLTLIFTYIHMWTYI